jgi:hypothetical protein
MEIKMQNAEFVNRASLVVNRNAKCIEVDKKEKIIVMSFRAKRRIQKVDEIQTHWIPRKLGMTISDNFLVSLG